MAKPINPARGPRPNAWVTGTDPLTHEQYRAFIQCRNQARFRSEPWTLSFEEWCAAWAGLWHLRGRSRDSLCITRADGRGTWSAANIMIVTRSQHGTRKRGIRILELNQTANDIVLTESADVRNRTAKS